MSVKVGEAYVEVEARFDHRQLRVMSAMAGREAAEAFSKGFDRSIAKNTETWDRFQQQRLRSARRTNLTMAKEMGISFRDSARQLGDGYQKNITVIKTVNQRIHKRIDRDSRGWASTFASHMRQGFEGLLSILPGRLEAVFTKTGPIVGTALMAGIAAAVVIGAPAIGAMFGGLFFGALGFGALIGAAIVGAVKDPRVNNAAKRLGDSFMDNLVYHSDIQFLGQTVANQLDKVTKKLNGSWGKNLRGILEAGGKFIPIITDGLIKMIDKFLGPLNKLMNSRFMSDLMKISAKGLEKIGAAFGEIFGDILKDPEAMEGMKKGLDDLFNLIAGGIKTLFDFVRWLSRVWEWLNKDPDGKLGEMVSPLDKMRDIWKDIRDILDGVSNVIGKIFGGENGPLGKSKLNDTKNTLADIASIIKGLAGNSTPPNTPGTNTVQGSGKLPYGSMGQTGTANQDRNGDAPGFGGAGGGIKGWWSDQWADIKAETNMAWQGIQKRWDQGLAAIKLSVSTAWSGVTGTFKAGWHQVQAIVGTMWQWTRTAFTSGVAHIQSAWHVAWANISNFCREKWFEITGIIKSAFGHVWGFIAEKLSQIKSAWFAAWWATVNTLRNVWGRILGVIYSFFGSIIAWISGQLMRVRQIWFVAWSAVLNRITVTWNSILSAVKRIFTQVAVWIGTKLAEIRNAWYVAWTAVRTRLTIIWNTMLGIVKGKFQEVAGFIWKKLTEIRSAWSSIWNGMKNLLGGIWNTIAGKVQTGLNKVLNIIQQGINLINKVLGALHIGFKIPDIGGGVKGGVVGGLAPTTGKKSGLQKATGGSIRGPGSGTSDSIPAWLSNGEHVWTAREVRAAGGHGQVEALRSMAVRGYAKGGGVRDTNNNGLMEQHRNHVHVAMVQGYNYAIQLARRAGFKVNPTSTFRPGDPLWHGKGKAADLGGYNQDGLAAFFQGKQGLLELIHRTASRDYWYYGGKGGSSGGGGGLFDILSKGWGWLKGKIGEAGGKAKNLFGKGNFMDEFGRGVIGKIAEGATGKAKKEFDEAKKAMASMGSSGGDGGNASRWTGVGMQALKMLHLPNSWIGPLIKLIARESGGNPRAVNNWDSNAKKGTPSKGLMQTIGPTFNANKFKGHNDIFNPLDNILAGLTYIKRRYGSIFNVQQAVGSTPKGYDGGGWLAPGGIARNYGSKPEMVLNPGQAAALEERIKGGGSGCTHLTKVYVDGVETAHTSKVEDNNLELANAIRRGYR